jgi:hypothetical protein
VKQLLAHALQEVADGLLSDAILKVRVHTTKGKFLLRIVTCLLVSIVVELPHVAVVVEDFHFMFGHVLLEGKLGGKCLCQQIVELKVNKVEMAVVIDKHGGTLIALLGEFSF